MKIYGSIFISRAKNKIFRIKIFVIKWLCWGVAGEVELKIGLVLHRCLQFLQFNTHETSGWDPDLVKDNSQGLGGGLFPTLALFNHSCNPAIVRYAYIYCFLRIITLLAQEKSFTVW